MKRTLALVAWTLATSGIQAQPAPKAASAASNASSQAAPTASSPRSAFAASELKFRGIFAQRQADATVYCLLGNGFFLTPRSDQADALLTQWLSTHPQAQATPVSIMGEGTRRPMVYLWLSDKDDHLALHLIRNGAYPGSVMLDAVHFEALSAGSPQRAMIQAGIDAAKQMSPQASEPEEKPLPPRRLVVEAVYQGFLARLQAAQDQAQASKVGVWEHRP
jgi:hypothetical protein